MTYLIGVCAALFALLAPLVGIAGLLTLAGVGGPLGLLTAACLMTGGWLLWRRP